MTSYGEKSIKDLRESKRAATESFQCEKSKLMEHVPKERPFYKKPFWQWDTSWHSSPDGLPNGRYETILHFFHSLFFCGIACWLGLFLPISFLLLLTGLPWFDARSREVYERVFAVTLSSGYATLILHALYFVWRGPTDGERSIALSWVAPKIQKIEDEQRKALLNIEKTSSSAFAKHAIKAQCYHCESQIKFYPFKGGRLRGAARWLCPKCGKELYAEKG
jgi:hypothetical protein